ncbi:MAG: hypothetical protein RIB58_01765 [Phycisphaerales bacterium]
MPSQHNPPPAAGKALTIVVGVALVVVAIALFDKSVSLVAAGALEPSVWLVPMWLIEMVLFSTGCVLLFGYRPMDAVEATVRIARAVRGQPDPRDRPPEA